MTTYPNSEITRPGAHSAKNARQTGAPNHLQGSGENPMVDNRNHLRGDGAVSLLEKCFGPPKTLRDKIAYRLDAEVYSYLYTARGGGLQINFGGLASLVEKMLVEHTDHITAERDALAEDLAWELNATRGTAGGEA